jgi:hypothetical protein
MDLNINDPAFLINLHSTTNPDPAIGFGLSISGDPILDITITQVFMGGPDPNLFTSGFGTLIDGINGTNGNGAASLTNAFIKTTVFGDGLPAVQQIDLNCAFAGQPLYSQSSIPCSSPSSAFGVSQSGARWSYLGPVAGADPFQPQRFRYSHHERHDRYQRRSCSRARHWIALRRKRA